MLSTNSRYRSASVDTTLCVNRMRRRRDVGLPKTFYGTLHHDVLPHRPTWVDHAPRRSVVRYSVRGSRRPDADDHTVTQQAEHRHMLYAWITLGTLVLTDFYVTLVAPAPT